MIRSEDLKQYREIAEWLESAEGRKWLSMNFRPIRYGCETTNQNQGTYGFFSLKEDNDASGSGSDFSSSMWWGNLACDSKLIALYKAGKYPEPLVR